MNNISLKPLKMNRLNVFFVFDRVLKDPDAYILKKIAKSYRNKFEDYIDIDTIATQSLESMMVSLMERNVINPLEWLAIKEFDYEKNYSFLYKEFKGIYKNSKELYMTRIVYSMLYDYSVGNIYVWNPVDDIRQRYDLICMFGKNNKIRYITGDYEKAIDMASPNIVYDWDIERVTKMNEYASRDNIFFGVADYSFNFENDPENPYKLKHGMYRHKNVAFFANIIANKSYKYKG